MAKHNYKCKFCNGGFVYEKRFLAHHCKQMKRDEEFRSIEGKRAWEYYKLWMKSNKRSAPNPDSFIQSRYFNTFIKFAKFVKQIRLPHVSKFIRLMKQKDLPPTMWTSDEVYQTYLEFIDHVMPPHDLAETSVETLFDVAEEYDVDVSDVFDHIMPTEVIQLIRQRRLSPWILLRSKKFRNFFANQTNTQEKIILETLIKPEHWMEMFQKQPETVKKMNLYVSELKL